ncbi:MAG: NAD-dependent epimerase/dehydratase family protein [Candidatus Omnitrophica bacterium]|nr:NAD-dependent epimerase/dehydratase family protein [Candidatus Omnitrophota bacterium]
MRALVTGGGGFVGRYIVERLLSRGDSVRVLARGRYPELEQLGVEMVSGDLRDEAAVARACAEQEAVFHTAARVGLWGPWEEFYDINVRGTQHVLAGCRAHGVARLIYTSTPSVVFDGRDQRNANEAMPYPSRYSSYYPATKAIAERAVIAANGANRLLTTALRPHLIWGPRDTHIIPQLLARAKTGRLVMVGDGRNLVDMTYVENCADAHLLAADRLVPGSPVAGQVYFLSNGEPVRLWGFINQVLARLGVPTATRRVPARLARMVGAGLEVLYRAGHLPGEPFITRFLASELSTSHYYDISKAKRDFGYVPKISMQEGLDRLAASCGC